MAKQTLQAGALELERWIRRISHGDRDALADLYHATSSGVYAYALSILRNQYDAEDVLHDCYVRIWSAAGSYRSVGKPLAWIMTVTRNLCLQQLQQQKRTVPLAELPFTAAGNSDPEASAILRCCTELLSDEERQIVVLHAVAGCKHREIAEMFGLKTSTVLSKYHRAIRKLRDNL